MNSKKTVQGIALALGALLSGAALAQSNQTPVLDKREARQEKRIEQGEKSGELTNKEAANLEAREAKLKADEAAAKADGKVTPHERKKLEREANRDSKKVYRKKHNERTK